MSSAVLGRMGLRLEYVAPSVAAPISPAERWAEQEAPTQREDNGRSTREFRAVHRRRTPEEETSALGRAGELLVLERERHRLTQAGRSDLAERIIHTAAIEGDGAGFDISSFFPDGRVKHIEVKTTTGPKTTDFFISANEVEFSARHRDSYELCRVFEFNSQTRSGKCYSLWGDISQLLELRAMQYRVAHLI